MLMSPFSAMIDTAFSFEVVDSMVNPESQRQRVFVVDINSSCFYHTPVWMGNKPIMEHWRVL